MGIKRIVDMGFWMDKKVEEFSPEDKYFMLYLLTNPATTQLGIYEISCRRAAFELGYSVDAVKVLIERFENKYGLIIYSEETNEVAIINYLRHSIVKGGAPVRDCLIKEIKKVKNKSLISKVFTHLKQFENLNATVKKLISDCESNSLRFSHEKENEIENDKDNENGNENDNDNEVSFDFSERFVPTDPKQQKNAYKKIKSSVMKEKENGEKICEWCGCKTSVLQKHHYPVPKRFGGKEVVNICSNCHQEFHKKEIAVFGSNNTNLEEAGNTDNEVKQFADRVYLSENQISALIDEMGIIVFDIYVDRLNNFIKEKNANIKNHYETLLKWYREDLP